MRQTQRYLIVLILVALITGCASNNRMPRPAGTQPNPSNLGASTEFIPDGDNMGSFPPPILKADEEDDILRPRDGDSMLTDSSIINETRAIETIYFGFNQSAISKAERSKLTAIARQMKDDPDLKILAEGHCDWRGTVEYNMALGERRAKSVERYLKNIGVNVNRIKTISKGDLNAVIEGTPEQLNKDRRVDLIPLN